MGEIEQSDTDQFTALFRYTYPRIRSFAERRVGPDAADEIATETYLAAWRHLHELRGDPLPWLYQVARSRIRARARGDLRRQRLQTRIAFQRLPDLRDERDDRLDTVLDALELLRERDQEVLRLVYWDGFNTGEAAALLGTSAGAVAVRLHRARVQLRRLLNASPVVEGPRSTDATQLPRISPVEVQGN